MPSLQRTLGVMLMCSSLSSLAGPLKIVLDVKDGSHLVGTTATAALTLKTAGKDQSVNLSLINSLTVTDDGQHVELVTLTSVEPLRGNASAMKLDVVTAFGKFSIPLSMIRHADIGEPPMTPGTLKDTLDFKCTDLASVEPITETSGRTLRVLVILFKNGPALMLTSMTRQEPAKDTLGETMNAIVKCKSAGKTFHVSNVKYFDAVDTSAGPRKGWSAPLENLHLD